MLTHSLTFRSSDNKVLAEATVTVESLARLMPEAEKWQDYLKALNLNASYYIINHDCTEITFTRFAFTAEELTNAD